MNCYKCNNCLKRVKLRKYWLNICFGEKTAKKANKEASKVDFEFYLAMRKLDKKYYPCLIRQYQENIQDELFIESQMEIR